MPPTLIVLTRREAANSFVLTRREAANLYKYMIAPHVGPCRIPWYQCTTFHDTIWRLGGGGGIIDRDGDLAHWRDFDMDTLPELRDVGIHGLLDRVRHIHGVKRRGKDDITDAQFDREGLIPDTRYLIAHTNRSAAAVRHFPSKGFEQIAAVAA